MQETFNSYIQNNWPFLRRFYIYQKERFPFIAHGLLIAAFSFSAISYSRICRGAGGFVDFRLFLIGIFTTITLFFLVRIFDEFKDAEEDAKYRNYLPVPRGLISFKELKILAISIIFLQVIIHILFVPKMIILYLIVLIYLFLMGKEFFVSDWLKKNQVLYVISHMFIIPLIDVYASGLDWFLADVAAPLGLIFFFAVSYFNGIVLEIGRKIRVKENEEVGVLTYSAMYGTNRATIYWLIILFTTFLLSLAASFYANHPLLIFVFLSVFLLICALPALLFLYRKTHKLSKYIEYSSALWTIAMYLILGGAPMFLQLLFQ